MKIYANQKDLMILVQVEDTIYITSRLFNESPIDAAACIMAYLKDKQKPKVSYNLIYDSEAKDEKDPTNPGCPTKVTKAKHTPNQKGLM